MRKLAWLLVVAIASVAHADGHAYIEKFLGWSKDGAFYAMTTSGTDEIDVPVLCQSRRGAAPASWPKDVPPPDPDDERGCSEPLDQAYPGLDPPALVAKVTGLVVAPKPASKGPHGETVSLRRVGDGSIVEVTVGKLARGYFELRDAGRPVPDLITASWRADGLAVAVEAGFAPVEQANGFGPPAVVVVLPLDGSAAKAERPRTPREQSRALNLQGMQLLTAGKRDQAQERFVAAITADSTDPIALYNLASVASLRKDASTAVLAIESVVDLARRDPQAKRALAKARTDHDLDYVAGESPYVAQLLGRPRTKGDDWCIAAEARARKLNLGNFIAVAEEAAPVIDARAVHGGLSRGHGLELSCHVRDGASQLSIGLYVVVTDPAKHEREVRVAWQIFPDGLFDADAFVDERQAKTVRLKALAQVGQISRAIATAK